MNVPMRRRGDDPRPHDEFERLRRTFASELERWPDFLPNLDDAAPLADIEETDDGYLLDVELPGVRREDIDLQVEQGRIVLTAQRRQRQRLGLLRHRTRTVGRFHLDIPLPLPVDSQGVTACLDHGLLSVVVPKSGPARRRRIAVQSR